MAKNKRSNKCLKKKLRERTGQNLDINRAFLNIIFSACSNHQDVNNKFKILYYLHLNVQTNKTHRDNTPKTFTIISTGIGPRLRKG